MLLHDVQNDETLRRWFLDSPQARVLNAIEERELLLELADCRRRIVEATRRSDGSERSSPIGHVEFQDMVRKLANSALGSDPHSVTVRLLARQYQEIRTKLAMANVRLVAHVAKRYYDRGIPAVDLLQEGFAGLLMAIDRFNPVNTTRLATYAVWWIRQAIQRAVAAGAYPVRLNPKQLQRLARAQREFTQAESRRPLDIGSRTVGQGPSLSSRLDLAAIRAKISLDAPSRFDGTIRLAELLVFPSNQDQDDSEIDECLGVMTRVLKPREHLVLKLRFGLDGEQRHSLSQVSKVLEVSKERIRQIQERALQKLRRAVAPCGEASSREVHS
jgi:RNA polymerase primary sigma factor